LGDVTRTLSRGYQQRAALARALLHQPSVYLYDEPYTGLDQDSSAVLDGLLEDARTNRAAVLYSTHDFSRGLTTATRAIILRGGRIVYEGERKEWSDAAGFGLIYAQHIERQQSMSGMQKPDS
jgi:ABC-type multidrug transport system ATPase subunit